MLLNCYDMKWKKFSQGQAFPPALTAHTVFGSIPSKVIEEKH